MNEAEKNWAGNYTYSAARVLRPETVEQVRELVTAAAGEGRPIKALGSRHSFNAVADTNGDLISLERLDRVISLDRERRTVTVEAGVRYGTLCRALHAEGFTLHNLASLPHISVAGAVATATHGSGDKNGSLATAVAGLELVTASGDVVTFTRERDGDRFKGAVVGLGALGIVTRVTLDLQPAFQVRQYVFEALPQAQLEANFDSITGSAYSVSLFTDWRGEHIDQVWVKERLSSGENEPRTAGSAQEFLGARAATVKRHPIISLSAENCTEQLGVPGAAHDRLPHFRIDHTPSSGAELQSEYFVPRRHALDAFRAVASISGHIAPLLQISEIRTIAADDLWLSPYNERDAVAFHFTWLPDWTAVSALLPALEERLAPFDARPHWGKLFTVSPDRLRALYPRLPDFQALARELDPNGAFRSPFLERTVL